MLSGVLVGQWFRLATASHEVPEFDGLERERGGVVLGRAGHHAIRRFLRVRAASELVLDRYKRVVEASAEQAQRGHDDDRDKGGDQAVLDCGGAGLVGEELANEGHGGCLL